MMHASPAIQSSALTGKRIQRHMQKFQNRKWKSSKDSNNTTPVCTGSWHSVTLWPRVEQRLGKLRKGTICVEGTCLSIKNTPFWPKKNQLLKMPTLTRWRQQLVDQVLSSEASGIEISLPVLTLGRRRTVCCSGLGWALNLLLVTEAERTTEGRKATAIALS